MNARWWMIAAFCVLAGCGRKTESIPPRRVEPHVTRALRPNYPYSVIPGGAYSAAELRYASGRDWLVREHYAGFDLRNARIVVSTEDRYQYASFRLKNAVFWTRRKLRIPKGETLLTDGHSYARTRCGNRLSDTPMDPTAADEPSEKSLSMPPVQPEMLEKGEIQLVEAPPIMEPVEAYNLSPLDSPIAPSFIPQQMDGNVAPLYASYLAGPGPMPVYIPTPVPIPSGNTPKSPTPPVTTIPPPIVSEAPEPASLFLFGATFCISLWFLTRMLGEKEAEGNATAREDGS